MLRIFPPMRMKLVKIQARLLQTRPVLSGPPDAMKDRARALQEQSKEHFNKVKESFQSYLGSLAGLFPDMKPSSHVSLAPGVDLSSSALPEDYKTCLKGIAKRLVVHGSPASTANMAQLVSLSDTPELLKSTLEALQAHRWHLIAANAPLSSAFICKAIHIWPVANDELALLLESSVGKGKNCACVLNADVLCSALKAISKRIAYGPRDDVDQVWNWCKLAFRLFNSSSLIESDYPVIKVSLLNIFTELSRLELDYSKSPAGLSMTLGELVTEAIESLLPIEDATALSLVLRPFVKTGKNLPSSILHRIKDDPTLVLFEAYMDGAVHKDVLGRIALGPNPNERNLRKFLLNSCPAT